MLDWEKKLEVKRYYDLLAPSYDRQYAKEQKIKMRTALDSVRLEKENAILDMGCGTGLLFEYIVDSAGSVVGVDLSRELLQKAKKRVRQFSNVHTVVHVLLADADYAPFTDHVFDNVFVVTTIQNVPDPVSTLKEISRVSKTQSTIIVTGISKKFDRNRFVTLLTAGGLRVLKVEIAENRKGLVAICRSH